MHEFKYARRLVRTKYSTLLFTHHRYGMLKENHRDGSNMEMRPLSEGDDDDDDDDLTLFDASSQRRHNR